MGMGCIEDGDVEFKMNYRNSSDVLKYRYQK